MRGYPPAPGQPPPVYPPGQFAAWNHGRGGQAGPSGPAATDGGSAAPGRGGSGGSGGSWQAAQAAGTAGPGSRYYSGDDGPDAEPGYSMLAVSDPAADVTSTQTWQAVGDGRATGIWTAPERPGADPGEPVPPGRQHADQPGPAAGGPAARGLGASTGASTVASTETGTGASGTTAANGIPEQRANSRGHGRSATRTGPDAVPASGPPAAPGGGSRRGTRGQAAGRRPRRGRTPSVKLAIGVALVLVVAAAATLAYSVLHSGAKPPVAAPRATTTPAASASASSSPSLGPNGHIGSRATDPDPLTIAQLFPATFVMGTTRIASTTSALSKNCTSALVGSTIKSVVRSAGCDQAARATYLSASQGLMGTIGVLNLSTVKAATKAVRAADASDYIGQLKAKHGPTRKIGGGTGIEEAVAKGHYLILIWAEFTSLHKPKTAIQRAAIEHFMTALLQNTANVSLTTRMLTGTP